jgi:hypothetical protein
MVSITTRDRLCASPGAAVATDEVATMGEAPSDRSVDPFLWSASTLP